MTASGRAGERQPWEDAAYLDAVCASLDGRVLGSGRRASAANVVRVEPGLSDRELEAAEVRFDLCFPPDLRALLRHGLPTGRDLPNWRDPDADDYLRWALGKPARAMEFDVLNNGVWFDAWGPRPATDAESAAIAGRELARVPRLVPVHAHRYVPSVPPAAGNPILSLWQIIDTVHAADDLAGFLASELGAPLPAWATPADRRRRVPFWSAIVETAGASIDDLDG
jgi:hypothetical protein